MSLTIQERLAAHRTLAGAPPDELAWLAARGHLLTLDPGAPLAAKGSAVMGLYIILS